MTCDPAFVRQQNQLLRSSPPVDRDFNLYRIAIRKGALNSLPVLLSYRQNKKEEKLIPTTKFISFPSLRTPENATSRFSREDSSALFFTSERPEQVRKYRQGADLR